jgi:hypothetical protein
MTMTSESLESVEQRIAVRAYEMWMGRGAPISDGKDDWFAARMEIEAELAMTSASASPSKRKAKVAKGQASTPGRTKVKSEGRRAQA